MHAVKLSQGQLKEEGYEYLLEHYETLGIQNWEYSKKELERM